MESSMDIVDEIITNGIQNYSFEHKFKLVNKDKHLKITFLRR